MTSFQVDTGELQALVAQMRALPKQLDSAAPSLQPVDGLTGSKVADHGFGSFAHEWSSGLDRLITSLANLADALDGAGGTYDSTESGITNVAVAQQSAISSAVRTVIAND